MSLPARLCGSFSVNCTFQISAYYYYYYLAAIFCASANLDKCSHLRIRYHNSLQFYQVLTLNDH